MSRHIEPDLQDVGYGQTVANHRRPEYCFFTGGNANVHVGLPISIVDRETEPADNVEIQTLQVYVWRDAVNKAETEPAGRCKKPNRAARLRLTHGAVARSGA